MVENKIGNTTDAEIAKVVFGEGSVFVGKNYDALLAIAQCIYDQWASGLFGSDLTQILNKNFCGKSDIVSPECLKAVQDVFARGRRRFSDARIFEFRSFTRYSDGQGNIASEKCSQLLQNYDYIGKDSINNQWGHFYFGKADHDRYEVQTGAFENKAYADQMIQSLKQSGINAKLYYQSPFYLVIADGFYTYEEAKKYSSELSAKGISNFVLKKGGIL